ncbi:hypothetical protein AgCh_004597 [Apium graveolens]
MMELVRHTGKTLLTKLLALKTLSEISFVAKSQPLLESISRILRIGEKRAAIGYDWDIQLRRFQITKETSHKDSLSMASSWNYAVNGLKSLCCGNDWFSYFK